MTVTVGDLLTFWPVGAYNNTQWMQFIHCRPAVVLVREDGRVDLIRAAEDWCEKAQAAGSLLDVLSVFAPSGGGYRMSSPLERVSVSEDVWRVIENCRNRGIITIDMAERLLEGVRAMDTRDWDDEDVRAFLLDACVAQALPSSHSKIERALHGDFRDYYC